MPHFFFTFLILLFGPSPLTRRAHLFRSALFRSSRPKITGYIDVPGGVDAGTRIPVIVFHGAWPGPVLAVVAGAHGTEYASIVAVELLAQLDRADLPAP